MTTITIDNQEYEVDEGHNLLHVALSLGLDLPYFCWHPALGSVGACRQCAVKQFKDENDDKGKLVMACMTPASDGTRIAIEDPEAREFRASVIEWLMTNHPHDCPVCDEGGECHLQDMTVMTGHVYRRFRFQKRTYRNQYLGPFINHEMNRCIACYRCVRFYRDYAGGRDFDVFATRNNVYFGRHEDGVLQNEFSGNLVEVCPTGVFTDKTLHEHYTRKWDLQTAPSVCTGCSLGCNILPGERYGVLRRIRNRYHHEINGYFLCDRGRYGYEFVNSERRIRQPILRSKHGRYVQSVTAETAVARVAAIWQNQQTVIGIGSPRASLEANFALRQLVGPENFYSGMATAEHRLVKTAVAILQATPAPIASLHDCENSDAALVLGEDLTNTAPRMALALRQAAEIQPMHILAERKIPVWEETAVQVAIQNRTGPIFLATVQATKLDEVACRTFHAAPDDLARLGFAVAHALDDAAPAVADLSAEEDELVQFIAACLLKAENPLVVAGTSSGSAAVLQAAANVVGALHAHGRSPRIAFILPESNSMGVALLDGRALEEALETVAQASAASVIVLENDLFRRAPREAVNELLENAEQVVALDYLSNDMTLLADVVLPAATFAEDSGTLVSSEGRAQRFFQVFLPQGDVKSSWQWLGEVAAALGQDVPRRLDEWIRRLAAAHPPLQGITEAAPNAAFRIVGQKIPRQ
ncbi:MAG: NADH-quinone oxidoreductase subunit NuoG, partial [Anaerolineales bacterium]|nr:NADH-quinone oxidoreductase subunit NuoG [Anaerolineales bacterium]